MKAITSYIYSKLSDNSSLVPLAVKDIANSCGLTTASYLAGDAVEGKDRFIDEFGTQAIWLWGIPAYKFALDNTLFRAAKLDPNVDARILKNPEIMKLAQKYAPSEGIKKSLEEVAKHPIKFKNLTVARFAASTILTAGTYLGLTKFRHNYTEKQIAKDFYNKKQQEQQNKDITFTKTNKATADIPFSAAFSEVHKNKQSKNVSFTGGMQDFIFDPVKNLMLVDATITGERLTHSRNPQDFLGYVIKEGSFWAFMYFAGPIIAKSLEKHADNIGRSIDLDARVIESPELKEAMKNGTLKKHINEFMQHANEDAKLYEFAVKPETKNFVIDMAKKSDIIECLKKTTTPDTRKYINLQDLRGIKDKLEKLLNQYENSGESIEDFLKVIRKMKKHAVLKNIGACIGALGILAPGIMLLSRKFSPEYQVKKDIEEKLAAQQEQ